MSPKSPPDPPSPPPGSRSRRGRPQRRSPRACPARSGRSPACTSCYGDPCTWGGGHGVSWGSPKPPGERSVSGGAVLAQQLPGVLVQQPQRGVQAGGQHALPVLAEAHAGDGAWGHTGSLGGPAEPPQLWESPQVPPTGPTHCRCSQSRAAPCGGRSVAPARPRSCGERGGLGGPQFRGCPGAGGLVPHPVRISWAESFMLEMPSLASSSTWMGSGRRERQSQHRTVESMEPGGKEAFGGKKKGDQGGIKGVQGLPQTTLSPDTMTVASSLNWTQFTFCGRSRESVPHPPRRIPNPPPQTAPHSLLTPACPRYLRTTCPVVTSQSATALSAPPEQIWLLSKDLAGRGRGPVSAVRAPRGGQGSP